MSEQSQLIRLERRTAARTIEQEFRLSGRLARWAGLGALGISLFVIGRPLYRYEAFWFLIGALSITLILLSTVGFIVDGLTYWRLAGAQNIERRDYYPSDHNPAPVQLIHRDRNRLFLTRHKLRPAQWARLAEILAANDWRFTRNNVAKAKVFENITSYWNDITEDFENRGYIRHDGIRYIVLPHARKLFAAYSPNLSHNHQTEATPSLIAPDLPYI